MKQSLKTKTQEALQMSSLYKCNAMKSMQNPLQYMTNATQIKTTAKIHV